MLGAVVWHSLVLGIDALAVSLESGARAVTVTPGESKRSRTATAAATTQCSYHSIMTHYYARLWISYRNADNNNKPHKDTVNAVTLIVDLRIMNGENLVDGVMNPWYERTLGLTICTCICE